jgi:hypothetical protein
MQPISSDYIQRYRPAFQEGAYESGIEIKVNNDLM